MNTFLKILLIAISGWLLQLFLPWWHIVAAAFIINLIIYSSGWKSFMAGFWGIFLLWTITAFYIDVESQSILSGKIAQIFQIGNSLLLVLATGLLGGICGGFSGLTASLLRNINRKDRSKYYYN